MRIKTIAATLVAALFSTHATAAAPVVDASGTDASETHRVAVTSDLTVTQRVERLERMLTARNQVQLDMQNQLDELLDSVAVLMGQMEQNDYEMQQMVQRQREIYQELDRRFAQLNTAAAKPQVQAPVASANEDEAYDAAVALVMEQRDYDAAIPAFEAFISSYPESGYASNAHYWLGQLHFTRGQRDQASTQFEIVVDRFPESNKAAESLLKLGTIATFNSDQGKAKQYFERVLSEYPGSSAAGLAEKELAKLG
ncbi:tol-pal system protein YbgF [Aliagarivorans taiwanensis]|uniref:tol-pal system protein YbgF n=1 Tax=Aliagarivorans taiwanensis TaxID=561966 RepID=UPI0003F78287|nr:tol-pal system protein YbgF [Aliagarivorans taiwanensis]